jgi:hypothetical protein
LTIAERVTKAATARREVNIAKLMVRSCRVEKKSWEMRPAQTKKESIYKEKVSSMGSMIDEITDYGE